MDNLLGRPGERYIHVSDRPDAREQLEFVSEAGHVVASCPVVGKCLAVTDVLEQSFFASGCDRLIVTNSSPIVSDGILAIDNRNRLILWEQYPRWSSTDWSELLDRSVNYLNTVDRLYSLVAKLCHEIQGEPGGDQFAKLLNEIADLCPVMRDWAEASFRAVDPNEGDLLCTDMGDESEVDFLFEWLRRQPDGIRRWFSAIFIFDFMRADDLLLLIQDYTVDPSGVVEQFETRAEYHIKALRFLVGWRPLLTAYQELRQHAPESMTQEDAMGGVERRYRNIDVASRLYVSRQAITNWKKRAPSHFPKQRNASASAWRKFILAAWPNGDYDPNDIPLY